MPDYAPLPVGVRMSDYGYWVVELSVSPWQRISVMICTVGITPEDAVSLALGSIGTAMGRKVG